MMQNVDNVTEISPLEQVSLAVALERMDGNFLQLFQLHDNDNNDDDDSSARKDEAICHELWIKLCC